MFDVTATGRASAMFDGTVTGRGMGMSDEMVTGQENAMFDGMVTGRGTPMSDEIDPTPSAAETYATVMANDVFDRHSEGNQLIAIEQLEVID